MSRVLVLVVLGGCTPAEDSGGGDTGDPMGVDCGEATTYDISITARVVDRDGEPVPEIDVFLDDRGWEYDLLGEGQTDPRGRVTFTAYGVTSLPNCWGTVLDYWLVAIDAGNHDRTAEDDMNAELYNAIEDGSLATDVSEFPLTLP